ncbi:uncharacterized protein LOC129961637 isoform X2 [Argiope bruennichi]|uniref:uncharacterized protein LOC129961637 isoform X2 n=1 Tax=Argiope bruennichi TaxID=94029 RepID=UPI002495A2CA|nr:uncharacterized protein LOC129961637 isoform X2 [Argiope bruennichi]
MDDVSNIINFDINENHSILANIKINDNILNGSAERSTTESMAFFESSPLAEKQILTSVSDNFKNEERNISFEEVSAGFASNNSEENISLLSLEAVTSKAESINSSSIVNGTSSSIKTSNDISFNSVQNNSECVNEFESDSYSKSCPSLNEISVGNVNFLPDALSDEAVCDNTVQCQKMSMSEMENIDSISTCVEELKHEKNNSCVVVPDLVDFSFREQENVTDDLLGSFTGIDSLSKQPKPVLNDNLEEISDNNPAVLEGNKPINTSAEFFENECANKRPICPSANHSDETATAAAAKDYTFVLDYSTNDFPCRESENARKESVSNALTIDNISIELEKSNKATDEVSIIDSVKLDVAINNEYSEVGNDEAAFQVHQNISANVSNEVSPLKVEKVSFDMSDKPVEEFSDIAADEGCKGGNSDEVAVQMSGNISNYETGEVSSLKVEKILFDTSDIPLEQTVDTDFAFKMPEVPSSNLFRNPDSVFKTQENSLTNENDEQFVDAVQFFKDPNSFQFLENIRTSIVQSGSPVPRSSLYVNFDPLHSKFQNAPNQDNSALTVVEQKNNDASAEKCCPEVVKKHLADIAARESLGNNILISFDSPKAPAGNDSKMTVQTPSPPKMITEEEHQQKLKIHELETQEAYLKKQKEMEMQIAKRDELLMTQQMIIEEISGISAKLSEEIRKSHEKIMSLEAENEKLKEDLKTSSEDLQSVENTFTDFYKRYEQCKGMLKSFKDNEEQLKQTILDLQAKEKEQEKMYSLLKERTEEMLEKANVEMDNVKRSGEAQLTVLKAQLKKAEMKISSLESDNKQIKIENSQLGGICDDLMAKVSRS